MQFRFPHLVRAAIALALVLAFASNSAAAAPMKIGVLASPNIVKANRTADQIDRIVIHTTEGSFGGAVSWLRNPKARGSAHFVVSRDGEVVQLVSTSDIAWHAGEKRTNIRSIGIEHEGWVDRPDSYTEVQYAESARLAGYLAHRFGIPVNREHIIGHDEVPHPTDPRKRGGKNGHTDPGSHWDWDRYLGLVRSVAENPERPEFVRGRGPVPASPGEPGPEAEAEDAATVEAEREPVETPPARGLFQVPGSLDGWLVR